MSVTVTRNGLLVLQHLATLTAPIQRADLCRAVGIGGNNLSDVVERLVGSGHARNVKRNRRGYAPLVEITEAGRAYLQPKPEPKPERVVVDDRPWIVPPPPAEKPTTAPTLAKFRNITHPPPPAPCPKPDGMSPGLWRLRTTALPSPLHEACARGTA